MMFPEAYLREYYSALDSENQALLRFFANTYNSIPPQASMLDFGCGPTIYALLSAAPRIQEAHLCDYDSGNLHALRRWVRDGDSPVDWAPFIEFALQAEQWTHSGSDVKERQDAVREMVKYVGACDAFCPTPLGDLSRRRYDIVVSNFCAESITDSREMWLSAMKNIFSLVRGGGYGILCALENARYYTIGDCRLPAVPVAAPDIKEALALAGFVPSTISVSSVAADGDRGYSGILMASAIKRMSA